ncbi:hypothetical protein BC833DRAFT_615948 [Globomyces pollinis-pini]|nr:hypothetical protein BC833DRAFT_615948 [Globomyces pollinis-pini]
MIQLFISFIEYQIVRHTHVKNPIVSPNSFNYCPQRKNTKLIYIRHFIPQSHERDKILSYADNPRVHKCLIAANYNGLVVEEKIIRVGVDNKTDAFLAKFPLGKVPVFEGEDGFTLYESGAIAHYIANREGSNLFGKNRKEAALVQQYVAFADNEFTSIAIQWIYPIIVNYEFNAAATERAKISFKRILGALNTQLATRTFLVGDRVTLADIALTTTLLDFYTTVLEPAFIADFKHVTRWFTTCVNQPHFKAVLGPVELCKKMAVYDANAKPKAVETPKPKAEAPKAKAPSASPAADEEAAPAPKAKNPLDLLPKSSFVLDDWKRFYSNNDTKPTAMDYFWKNFDPTGYTIWKVDYKYNDELTYVFMSSNLIGGFFQRLEHSRKYLFGSLLVLGEDNKNEITGYFVLRGDKISDEIEDTADFPSFNFKKVDHTNPKVREHIASIFAWDEKIDGKVCADGKTFK